MATDFPATEVKNTLAGTGLKIDGMVTGYQFGKASTDPKTGQINDAKHYLFLACDDSPGVKVKMKREPDPSSRPKGSIVSVRVKLSTFNSNIYYTEI